MKGLALGGEAAKAPPVATRGFGVVGFRVEGLGLPNCLGLEMPESIVCVGLKVKPRVLLREGVAWGLGAEGGVKKDSVFRAH
jgi:hypothetical protein